MKVINTNCSQDRRRVLQNFFSLSVLQGMNYLLPLVTLPYLARVLGPEKFGLIVFAQALIQYFVLFTDYGFNYSATREVSIHRGDPQKVSEIFNSVMLIKLSLLLGSGAVLFLMMRFIPRLGNDWRIYWFTFGMVVGNVLFPVWIFQGMERMGYITCLNLLTKIIFTVTLFMFVQTSKDYWYVPLFNSLGYFIAGILSLWIAIYKFKLRLFWPGLAIIRLQFRSSFYYFLSQLSMSLYTVANIVVLGIFTNNTITGYFAAADKLIRAIEALLQPVIMAIYPYMSRTKNIRFFRKIFLIIIVSGIVLYLGLFNYGAQIISIFYGEGYSMTVRILKIFILDILIVFPSAMLNLPFLAALGHGKLANLTNVAGAIIQIIAVICIIPVLNVYILAGLTVFIQFIVLSLRIWGSYKYSLWIYGSGESDC